MSTLGHNRILYTPHPRALQVMYGDVETFAHAQDSVLIGTAGSLLLRQNGHGFKYYARQYYDAAGKKREAYVAGPVGDAAAEAQAAELAAQMADTKALTATLRLLVREGYQAVDPRTAATLAVLHNHKVFRAGAVLVGSHAFGVLLNQLGVRASASATEDIDLARQRSLTFTAPPKLSLLQMLCESGNDFVEVPSFERGQPSTSYKQRGRSSFALDLLAPSANLQIGVVEVPELQAHATSLPYLRYLLTDTQTAPVLAREGCALVRVPSAERFALHKLIASQLRAHRSAKVSKDIAQAAVVLAVLAEQFPGAIAAAVPNMPKGAMRYIKAALPALQAQWAAAHPRAWEELADAIASSAPSYSHSRS